MALFLWFTVLFANFAEADRRGPGQGAGRHAAQDPLRDRRSPPPCRRHRSRRSPSTALDVGDECRRDRGRGDPERRRGDRGHRQRRRVGDHGRVGAGHPRVGRRPLGGHRRHAGAVRRDRRADHRSPGRDVPRPDDRARRGLRRARRRRTRSRSTSCSPGSRSSSCSRPSRSSRSRCSPTPSRPVVILVALLVCLIPTTIGALLSAIGIAGMDRLVRRNVLAMSGRAVEAAGDCATLLLDKTGTITFGNRAGRRLHPRQRRHASRSSPTPRSSRASPTRRPRGARSSCSRRSATGIRERELVGADARPVHGADPHERRRLRRPVGAQGRGRRGAPLGGGAGRHRAARARRHRRLDRGAGRHAARRRRGRSRAAEGSPRPPRALGVDLPEGHREAGHRASASPTCGAWASAR